MNPATQFLARQGFPLVLAAALVEQFGLPLPTGAGGAVTNSILTKWAVSARWENDTFGGSDRYYTDGVALSLTQTGPNWLDPLADRLPCGQGRRTVGYDVAQLMFTLDNETNERKNT